MKFDFDDPEIYQVLLDICKPCSVDPSSSLESENFFRKLLAKYEGDHDLESLSDWLESQISQHFIAVMERPRWIQDPEWPFVDGEPLVFVGQIDLSVLDGGVVSRLYHDDTSLYVFAGWKVRPIVIVQQF